MDSYGRTFEGMLKTMQGDIEALKQRASFRPYNYTPSGSSDPAGNPGDLAWDESYLYLRTHAGWRRIGSATF